MICYNFCKELYSALCCPGGFHVKFHVGNLNYLDFFQIILVPCKKKSWYRVGCTSHRTGSVSMPTFSPGKLW